jgi:hypothetical protein
VIQVYFVIERITDMPPNLAAPQLT